MLITVVVVFGAAFLVPLVHRRWPRLAAFAAVGVGLCVFIWFAAMTPRVTSGGVLLETFSWFPSLGVTLSFALDGLSLVFALLVTGIGTLVLLYSISYMETGLGRFLGLLLLFFGSMLGLVLTDDAIPLYVFWELTSISSFFLIAFDHRDEESRSNALKAMLITALGGLALLTGLLLIGEAAADLGARSFRLSVINGLDVRAHDTYPAIVALVTVGAFTKSAQLPFHSWLPDAMVAPTPVSAYLHSAALVKAGVYLLARLSPSLGGTDLWIYLLTTVGAVTFIWASFLAVQQRDLKLTLAYATISILGGLILLLGLGTKEAIKAFVLMLVAHAAYKAALFMVAGNVDHQTGTRDPFAVRGLAGQMPWSAIAALTAAASMVGFAPFIGFIAKEAILLATAERSWLLAAGLVAGAALLVTAALMTSWLPFLGKNMLGKKRSDAPVASLVGPLTLAITGLLIGLAPDSTIEPLVQSAASATAGRKIEADVALWHGISGIHGAVLAVSLASVLLGSLVFAWVVRHPPSLQEPTWMHPLRAYDRTMSALWSVADSTASFFQSGLMRRYLFFILGFAGIATGAPLLIHAIGWWPSSLTPIYLHEALLVVLAASGAVLTVLTTNRITAIAAVGTTGFGISFLFAFMAAPDVAITQIMVEVLMVILLILVFRRLGPAVTPYGPGRRVVHLVVSAMSGTLVGALALSTGSDRFSPDASEFFIRKAPEEHAMNVVNAILTNFRAFDTLGEISVLAIAGVGVFALLRLRPGSDEKEEQCSR